MKDGYDLLIVGAGLFGATSAYELARKGYRCLVIEKRGHIGGNCYTEMRDGINLHMYGPHIFHTHNRAIWGWINQFAVFNHYRHRVKVSFEGRIYSFPPNLSTFNQLWGIKTPIEAEQRLRRARIPSTGPDNLESYALSQVGPEIYEIFIKGYSEKQWRRNPATLPSSIIKRIPVRLTYDDNYFDDPHQGIPVGGYTAIFERLLSGIDVRLHTDYFEARNELDSMARKTLYTGPLDRFFEYRFGKLEYLSVKFAHMRLEIPDFQGVAQMNYTSKAVPYTRIVEHKHFEFGRQPLTWITQEYPLASDGEHEMYPVRDTKNLAILKGYQSLCKQQELNRYYFGGRLAEYQYYDMHQIIAAALNLARRIERDLGPPATLHAQTKSRPQKSSVSL